MSFLDEVKIFNEKFNVNFNFKDFEEEQRMIDTFPSEDPDDISDNDQLYRDTFLDLYVESVENAIFKNTPLVDHVEFYESFEKLMANYRKMRIDHKKSASTEYGEWASGVDILKDKRCKVVLTPHVGEFARLTGLSREEIKNNPVACAKDFAKKYNVTLLLKNATSIITDGERVVINTTGNSGLAKGGSGDVLSGLIAGIIARGEDLFESVAVSAYLFGLSADIAVQEQNEYTITATDVINAMPKAINLL
jgi:hydroxyethylthiazole kinase-like uncharacterized protein yjeF